MFRPPFRVRFYGPALRIHALATDTLLRQPSLATGPVRGHHRPISSSGGSLNNNGTSGNNPTTGIQALVAPAEDAATREKAIGWLTEFVGL
jgi:hypothetical protein